MPEEMPTRRRTPPTRKLAGMEDTEPSWTPEQLAAEDNYFETRDCVEELRASGVNTTDVLVAAMDAQLTAFENGELDDELKSNPEGRKALEDALALKKSIISERIRKKIASLETGSSL